MRIASSIAVALCLSGVGVCGVAGAQPLPSTPTGALAAEDVAPPPLTKDLPFYQAEGRKLVVPKVEVPPPPEPSPPLFLGFVSRIERVLLPGWKSEGTSYQESVAFGGRLIDAELGYVKIGAYQGAAIGINFFRYASGAVVAGKERFRFSVVPPALSLHTNLLFASGQPDITTLSLTLDAVGLRFAGCLGGIGGHITLRGPSLGGGIFVAEGSDPEPFVSYGGVLEGGLIF